MLTTQEVRKRVTKISHLPWKPQGHILDPYAGNKRWWIGTNADVTFTDKYFCATGVLQADVGNLPFPDNTFDEIWADPPHLIRKSAFKPSSRFFKCSSLTPDQPIGYFGVYPTRYAVHDDWSAAAKELNRVCKDGGFLIWKSITGAKTKSQCVNRDDLDCLRPYWEQIDELSYPSVMSWSTATTIYTKWVKLPAPAQASSGR